MRPGAIAILAIVIGAAGQFIWPDNHVAAPIFKAITVVGAISLGLIIARTLCSRGAG